MTILSVYFSGTAFYVESLQYMAGLLYLSSTDEHQMGFDGCGVTDGIMGALFATGLDTQCEAVVHKVHELLQEHEKVTVNCYGHSRGGVAALMLAKMLGGFSKDVVEVNLALLDPVPGNLISSATMDLFNNTLANQVMDLSECHNLNRVLAIYPYEPLPDWAFHAPILPTYPHHTQLEEECTLGCHAEVERTDELAHEIARTRVIEFMKSCGSTFDFKKVAPKAKFEEHTDTDAYLKKLEKTKYSIKAFERPCHSKRGSKIGIPMPIKGDENWALNAHHRKLKARKKGLLVEESISEEENSFSDLDLLRSFAAEITKGLTATSLKTKKGKIIEDYLNTLDTLEEINEAQSIKILRNLIAVLLQRDRYALSFFTTTQSGLFVKECLAQEKYQPLASLIQGTTETSVRYRDLRTFVLGYNNAQFFNAENKERNFRFLEEHLVTDNNNPNFIGLLPSK